MSACCTVIVPSNAAASTADDKTTTVYLRSHHIYSKIKKRDIASLTRRLKLNGFMVTGKPGYICVQGTSVCVSVFLTTVKRWQWQRLEVKVKEEGSSNLYNKFEVVGAPPGSKSDINDLLAQLRSVEKQGLLEEITGFKLKSLELS